MSLDYNTIYLYFLYVPAYEEYVKLRKMNKLSGHSGTYTGKIPDTGFTWKGSDDG